MAASNILAGFREYFTANNIYISIPHVCSFNPGCTNMELFSDMKRFCRRKMRVSTDPKVYTFKDESGDYLRLKTAGPYVSSIEYSGLINCVKPELLFTYGSHKFFSNISCGGCMLEFTSDDCLQVKRVKVENTTAIDEVATVLKVTRSYAESMVSLLNELQKYNPSTIRELPSLDSSSADNMKKAAELRAEIKSIQETIRVRNSARVKLGTLTYRYNDLKKAYEEHPQKIEDALERYHRYSNSEEVRSLVRQERLYLNDNGFYRMSRGMDKTHVVQEPIYEYKDGGAPPAKLTPGGWVKEKAHTIDGWSSVYRSAFPKDYRDKVIVDQVHERTKDAMSRLGELESKYWALVNSTDEVKKAFEEVQTEYDELAARASGEFTIDQLNARIKDLQKQILNLELSD